MFLFYSVYLMTLTKNNAHAAACIAAENIPHAMPQLTSCHRQGVISQAVYSIAK